MLSLPYNPSFTQPVWNGRSIGDIDNKDPNSLWLRLKHCGSGKFDRKHLALLSGVDVKSAALACGVVGSQIPDDPGPLEKSPASDFKAEVLYEMGMARRDLDRWYGELVTGVLLAAKLSDRWTSQVDE